MWNTDFLLSTSISMPNVCARIGFLVSLKYLGGWYMTLDTWTHIRENCLLVLWQMLGRLSAEQAQAQQAASG